MIIFFVKLTTRTCLEQVFMCAMVLFIHLKQQRGFGDIIEQPKVHIWQELLQKCG